jgi:hypothetical protein
MGHKRVFRRCSSLFARWSFRMLKGPNVVIGSTATDYTSASTYRRAAPCLTMCSSGVRTQSSVVVRCSRAEAAVSEACVLADGVCAPRISSWGG